MAKNAPELKEEDLRGWKFLRDFRQRLGEHAPSFESHPSWQDTKRKLEQFDYLSAFLFGLVNPVLKTMNALCAASKTRRMQKEVCSRPISSGAFSEAQHLVEPQFLEKLIASLSQECQGPLPPSPHDAWQLWLARDSSIFPAMSRMVWARHGAGTPGRINNAVRLHVSFHLLEDKPVQVAVSAGRQCERKVMREQLQAGATYVGDRYFAEDYKLFEQLEKAGCRFVLRLRDEAVVQNLEQNPLSPEELAAGIVSDYWAELGCKKRYRTARVRVITIRKTSGVLMRLVTNIPPGEMRARDIQVLYRRRWQVEGFFRWIKCLLGCRHWLAESPRGVAIQLYLAIIIGLMLQMLFGRRPNQRVWERVQMYLLGWATLDEMMNEVERAKALIVKKLKK